MIDMQPNAENSLTKTPESIIVSGDDTGKTAGNEKNQNAEITKTFEPAANSVRFVSDSALDTVTLTADAIAAESVNSVTLNRDGTVRKKPGRKPGVRSYDPVAPAAPASAAIPGTAAKTPAQKAQVKATADMTARLMLGAVVGFLMTAIGPEWDFVSQEEADGLRLATASYIEAKGGGELSPEMCLLLAFSGYALSRTKTPNTREKIGAFFGGCWRAIRGVFSR